MKNSTLTPDESRRLGAFLEEHFDFDGLKQMGFWPKGMRRKDYEGQAKRICEFFGYSSVYQYGPVWTQVVGKNKSAVIEGVGHVTPEGKYEPGVTALVTLDTTPTLEFSCPVCTCPNELPNAQVKQKRCKGCKRTLGIAVDHAGGINVWEK